ncbi:hypothetical protein HMPREF9095_1550 [Haemophilus aegyptius ATCC 11116]|nr:hypothetical protein HMPREF9095_1550 [Haemophilus aegyptius ATCC 11116]
MPFFKYFPLKKPFIKTLQISTALYQDKTCKRDIIFTNSRKINS